MLEQLRGQFREYPLDFYSHLFLLLPVAMAVYRRKLLTPALALVGIYFTIRFLEECVFLYYALLVIPNRDVISRTLLLDTLIVGLIYYLSFESNRSYRRITVAATIIVFMIGILNALSISLTSISWPVIRLLMIVLSLIYFNKLLAENRVRKVVLHSFFWVCAGFLFYGMGTFMTSIFDDYLIASPKNTYNAFSYMKELLSILCSTMVALGLWVSKYDKDNYIQLI